ncbi:phosphoglucosamine mutase [Ilumatobacter nonamiensis]|uniref:phosphoglucosamine mutase n=1 Tax=Ilumatobacter nonamiensis TaxID=467093 RepID=UPI000349225A|nr:phosphoglucosamine mutase [Ilumatobacter nonamiensis]
MKFGTDGVRGVAHDELTTEFAARLARAASRVLGAGASSTVVIGGDTRESTPAFDAALTDGFAAEGVDVIRLGVVPTPLVAFEAQRTGAMGAMVSASHNPFDDNGIKLFAPGGTKLSDQVESRIEQELDALADRGVPPIGVEARATTIVEIDGTTGYVDHVLRVLEGRRLDGLRIVLDAANGAASVVGPAALRAAGAEVIVVSDAPDGRNINAGCGATFPQFVAAAVVEHGADVGIALDGDADRLIAVDHRGNVVDGDHIIAICAVDMQRRGLLAEETVVVTVMTNLGFRIAMDAAGIEVVETAVGDRYVLEALAAGAFSLGGEQSGHVIFTDHATTGDGLLTALALLDVVQRSERPLAEIAADAMTSLPQVLVNVRVATRVPDVAEQLADDVARVEAELGSSGRVLLRASGTEPLIRVMVEAPTAERAQSAADDLADIARTRFT